MNLQSVCFCFLSGRTTHHPRMGFNYLLEWITLLHHLMAVQQWPSAFAYAMITAHRLCCGLMVTCAVRRQLMRAVSRPRARDDVLVTREPEGKQCDAPSKPQCKVVFTGRE